MEKTDMAIRALGVGIITGLFMLYMLFGVYFPAGGKFEDDAVLAVFAGIALLLNITGLVFGILGLGSARPRIALAGIVLCAVLLIPLAIINISMFPANSLSY